MFLEVNLIWLEYRFWSILFWKCKMIMVLINIKFVRVSLIKKDAFKLGPQAKPLFLLDCPLRSSHFQLPVYPFILGRC